MEKRKGIIIVLLALVLAVTGRAQGFTPAADERIEFVIEGRASDGADSVIFKERPYTDRKKYPVHKGRFRIVVRQPLHKFIQIEDGKGGWMVLIVDNQPNQVTVDFRTNTVVEGSLLNKRFNRYQLARDSIESELQLHEEDADRTVSDSLEGRLEELKWKAIAENLDNVIPVYYLSLIGQFSMISPEQLSECMKEEYAFTHHPDMERVWKYYRAMQKRLPGQDYHDIELPDTTGTLHCLSEYVGHGHYVLLDFWASWCAPCVGSMPMMKKLYDTYAGRGLQIIGISLDRTREAWLSAIRRLDLPWIHLSDVKGWESIASEIYGVNAIPEIVLIDPDGKIIATGLREQELEAKLDEIFNGR